MHQLYSEELSLCPNEKAVSAIAFLKATVAYYAALGVTVTRVMTDNGSCCKAKDFAKACKALGLKHIRTRPYTHFPNSKTLSCIPCRNLPEGIR